MSLVACLLLVFIVSLSGTRAQSGPAYTVERYALANYPVALAFAPDGRLFYTEKAAGNVRVINADGRTQPEPVIHLETDALVERGLLGIALDPGYSENGLIWVVHTAVGSARRYPANEVVRFQETDGLGSAPEVMFSVPITTGELLHNGGNLHFDADGLLYLSLGDYGDAANAQDLSVPQGKIHRFQVTDDGLLPAADNPFPDSSIYAYGLRNSFDFAFDPVSGAVFATENGLHCDDEINRILPGMNYGWKADYGLACYGVEGVVDVPDYMPPLLSYNPTIAPTGIIFYDGEAFPEWAGDLFFCAWKSGSLFRAELNAERTAVEAVHEVDLQGMFCRIDVVVGPEGGLYFTDPGGIYRLLPAGGNN